MTKTFIALVLILTSFQSSYGKPHGKKHNSGNSTPSGAESSDSSPDSDDLVHLTVVGTSDNPDSSIAREESLKEAIKKGSLQVITDLI